jgi:hypothetical protein
MTRGFSGQSWSSPAIKTELSKLKLDLSALQFEHIQKVVNSQLESVKNMFKVVEVKNTRQKNQKQTKTQTKNKTQMQKRTIKLK